ncbi:MAG: hypothetical protein HQK52_05140 [Oligoflexia bacterium]|nr:hypothetical protein [Oligoflexia bacterium]
MKFETTDTKDRCYYLFSGEVASSDFTIEQLFCSIKENREVKFHIFDLKNIFPGENCSESELLKLLKLIMDLKYETYLIINPHVKKFLMKTGVDVVFTVFESREACDGFIMKYNSTDAKEQLNLTIGIISAEVIAVVSTLIRSEVKATSSSVSKEELCLECIQKVSFKCFQIQICLYFPVDVFEKFSAAIIQDDSIKLNEEESIGCIKEFFNILRGRIRQGIQKNIDKTFSVPSISKKNIEVKQIDGKIIYGLESNIGTIFLEIS